MHFTIFILSFRVETMVNLCELLNFVKSHRSKVSSKSHSQSQVKISWLAPMASREGKEQFKLKSLLYKGMMLDVIYRLN